MSAGSERYYGLLALGLVFLLCLEVNPSPWVKRLVQPLQLLNHAGVIALALPVRRDTHSVLFRLVEAEFADKIQLALLPVERCFALTQVKLGYL